jgi:chromosome segregation ATPase
MRERLERAERARTEAEAALERAREQIGRGDERIGTLERELGAVRAELDRATAAASAAASAPPPTNGSPAAAVSSEVLAVIEEIEERVREEMRTLTVVEDTLARAREESARVSVPAGDRTEQDRLLASKDAQLAEGRLEMARIRRDAEAREAALAREISDLRSKLLGGTAAGGPDDYSTQLIFMHTTLANIRRRAARLRVELEGFRRRLDTLPPGALSSMLEEIGEDLAEFAK